MIDEFSSLIIKAYKRDTFTIEDGVYHFSTERNNIIQNYLLAYRIDKAENILYFKLFRRIEDDAIEGRAIDLGLGNFFEKI
jgi:hypothetical protein